MHEPERPPGLRRVRNPIDRAALRRLGSGYWWVVAIASVFALARFSEAFLILKAQAVGLPIALVPGVLVVMNLVYAMVAYPAGALSDRVDRPTILMVGFVLLLAADLVLAMAQGIAMAGIGVALWGCTWA